MNGMIHPFRENGHTHSIRLWFAKMHGLILDVLECVSLKEEGHHCP